MLGISYLVHVTMVQAKVFCGKELLGNTEISVLCHCVPCCCHCVAVSVYVTLFFISLGGAMIGVFAGGMGAPRMGPVGSGMSRFTCFHRT